MSDCTQGALNKQSIEHLAEQTKLLFSMRDEDRKIQIDILNTLTEIKTIQDEERKHRISIDGKFTKHIEDSKDRISDIESNTAFRKIGCWVIGLVFTAVGWLISKL